MIHRFDFQLLHFPGTKPMRHGLRGSRNTGTKGPSIHSRVEPSSHQDLPACAPCRPGQGCPQISDHIAPVGCPSELHPSVQNELQRGQ